MGKVRPISIKKPSKEILAQYPSVFNQNFEENKRSLQKYAIIDSKPNRNRIAGYISHLVKYQKLKEE